MALSYYLSAKVSDLDKARELVVQALNADGCKVIVESPTRLTASRGSQLKMRLLGGAFVNIKVLPVRLGVDFIDTGAEQRVNFSAVDDLEFGLMIGMETRYREAVQDVATVGFIAVDSIRIPEEQRTGSVSSGPGSCRYCADKLTVATGFCSGCGSPIA